MEGQGEHIERLLAEQVHVQAEAWMPPPAHVWGERTGGWQAMAREEMLRGDLDGAEGEIQLLRGQERPKAAPAGLTVVAWGGGEV